MGFLDRLLRRRAAEPATEKEVSATACPHVTLLPHWEDAEDMGKSDRVARYTCAGCDATFSHEEGQQLIDEEAERVRLADAKRLEGQ